MSYAHSKVTNHVNTSLNPSLDRVWVVRMGWWGNSVNSLPIWNNKTLVVQPKHSVELAWDTLQFMLKSYRWQNHRYNVTLKSLWSRNNGYRHDKHYSFTSSVTSKFSPYAHKQWWGRNKHRQKSSIVAHPYFWGSRVELIKISRNLHELECRLKQSSRNLSWPSQALGYSMAIQTLRC